MQTMRRPKRDFACVVFLAAVAAVRPAQATTIIAVLSPTAIFLAGDSMVTNDDGSIAGARCKTKGANNVFWGESGDLEAPSLGFSVDEIAEEAMSSDGPWSSRINVFESEIVPRLTKVVNEVKDQRGESALQIVFVGFEDGIAKLDLIDFVPAPDYSTGFISVKVINPISCPGANCRNTEYVALGYHDVVDSEIAKNSAVFRSVPEGIRHLIEMEIAAKPTEVGPPISLLEITINGPKWLSAGLCAR